MNFHAGAPSFRRNDQQERVEVSNVYELTARGFRVRPIGNKYGVRLKFDRVHLPELLEYKMERGELRNR